MIKSLGAVEKYLFELFAFFPFVFVVMSAGFLDSQSASMNSGSHILKRSEAYAFKSSDVCSPQSVFPYVW